MKDILDYQQSIRDRQDNYEIGTTYTLRVGLNSTGKVGLFEGKFFIGILSRDTDKEQVSALVEHRNLGNGDFILVARAPSGMLFFTPLISPLKSYVRFSQSDYMRPTLQLIEDSTCLHSSTPVFQKVTDIRESEFVINAQKRYHNADTWDELKGIKQGLVFDEGIYYRSKNDMIKTKLQISELRSLGFNLDRVEGSEVTLGKPKFRKILRREDGSFTWFYDTLVRYDSKVSYKDTYLGTITVDSSNSDLNNKTLIEAEVRITKANHKDNNKSKSKVKQPTAQVESFGLLDNLSCDYEGWFNGNCLVETDDFNKATHFIDTPVGVRILCLP